MVSALRVTTEVLPGHRVEVDAQEFAVGDTVDVIIIPREEPAAAPRSALDVLEDIHRRGLPKTVGNADEFIRQERDSWDR